MFRLQKAFFIIIAVIILLAVGLRVALVSGALTENGHSYEITVLNTNGVTTTYFTRDYSEEDKCITFKDEFGVEQKICGQYQITKW